MGIKAKLLDSGAMDRALTRLSHEIVEKNGGVENVVLIGIKTRGLPLANRVAEKIKKAYDIFEKYIEDGLKENPPFKGVGKAYIRFASEKPKLFQLLFMKEKGVETKVERLLNNAEEYGKVVSSITSVYPVTDVQAANLYKHLWIYAHGIAVLIATRVCTFSDEEISDMLTVVFVSLLKEYLNKK